MLSTAQPSHIGAAEDALGIARRRHVQPPTASEVADARDVEAAKSARLWLGLIVVLALAVRLLLFALGPATQIQRAMAPESTAYLAVAQQMLDNGNLAVQAVQDASSPSPAYAMLLALTQWLQLPWHALLLAQIAVSAALPVVVYKLGRPILRSRKGALGAAAIVALHPASVLAPMALLPNTFLAALLLIGLCLAASRKPREMSHCVLGGLALGLSMLVRPFWFWLGPAVAGWMVIRDRRLQTVAAATVVAVMSVAPWVGWMWWSASEPAEIGVAATLTSLWDDPPSARLAVSQAVARGYVNDPLDPLYARLGLTAPAGEHASLVRWIGSPFAGWRQFDGPGDYLAVACQGLNALLLAGAIVGLVLLAIRGQGSALILLGGLLVGFTLVWTDGPGHDGRVVALAVEALAVMPLFLSPPRRKRSLGAWLRNRLKRNRFELEEEPILPPRPASARPI